MRKKKNKKKTPPNHLAIYIRVSTDKQVESGISLKDQRDRGIECANSLGWDYTVFEDGGKSGTLSYKDRPQFFEMMNMIDERRFAGLWVVDIDRLSRSDEGQFLITFLKDQEIRVFENGVEKDLTNAESEVMIRIKSIFASYEVNKMTSRIQRALLKNAKDGKVGGGQLLPFGYDKANKRLVINKEEAEIVRLMYKMSLDGLGTRQIANYLNENNIPTKRGRVTTSNRMLVRGKVKTEFTWKDAVVYRILTNPLYKGKRLYKEIEVDSPIIIEPTIFDLVGENLSKKNRFKSDTKFFYLLKGMIYCEKCGGSFYGRKRLDLTDQQYCCISQRDKGKFCGNRGINIDRLDNLVWGQILDLEKAVDLFFIDYEKKDKISEQVHIYNVLNNALKRAEDDYSNLLMMGAKKNIKEDLLNKELDKLNNRIDNTKQAIQDASKQLNLLNEKEKIKGLISGLVKRGKKENITDEEKQHIIRALVGRIEIKWIDNSHLKPSPVARVQHSVKIIYKLNALSSYKISNVVNVGYKKKGWRYDFDDVVNTELEIEENVHDKTTFQKVMSEGHNPVTDYPETVDKIRLK